MIKISKYFRNTSRKALSERYGIHERRKQYMMVVGRRMSNMKFGIRTPSLKDQLVLEQQEELKDQLRKLLYLDMVRRAEDGLRILIKLPRIKSIERRL